MRIKIAPAIMDADLGHLADAIAEVQEAGADLLHVDIMDGHYVPAFAGGPRVVAAIKRYASIPVDVHLMVTNPHEAAVWFMDAGADIVLFHPDATEDPAAFVEQVHAAGRRVGAALKPDVPADAIRQIAAQLDCVVAMTVQPGFSGQKFQEAGCEKIPALRRMCGEETDIYVDGGISANTAPVAVRYGANVLAAASGVFRAGIPPAEAVRNLRCVAEAAASGAA